ncbi:hypothetical protein [Pseudomonas sivasensis]|uniref:hypothetical protein n=1 Tax=Pseudomonas sivasensis TaxID=1880678 RepID=UPI001F5BC507|nr:hypothetical protein [Pseudomonas sivasensis]
MGWYKAGTVSVTAGSNAVIGSGTSFIANARVGDGFRGPDGRWYEVSNIASDTALSIAPNYQGTTAAGGGYSLAPFQGYLKDSADQLRAATKVIAATATDMSAQIDQARVSAESATASAGTATTKAGEALASSNNATSRASAALSSQNAAKASETNAKTYADQAAASASIPLSTPLTGFSAANAAPIVAADTILTAFGKAQGQANLGGWAVSKQTVADINAVSISQKFDISDAAGTANIPFRMGSTTVRFDAGSTGIVSQWGNFASSKHWQMLIFDRTSTNIAYRRMSSGVVQPDDYIVVYPTGKTVLDISQGGTGSATGVPNMVGATASAAGVKGLVPAPAAGDQVKFLAGDGTYKAIAISASYSTITGSPTDSSAFVTEMAKYQLKADIVAANQIIAVGTFTTAAPPVLSASNNIASVTRVAVGTYTINMSRTLKAGFKVMGFTGGRAGSSYIDSFLVDWTTTGSGNTASIRVLIVSGTTLVDPNSAPTQVVIIGEWA